MPPTTALPMDVGDQLAEIKAASRKLSTHFGWEEMPSVKKIVDAAESGRELEATVVLSGLDELISRQIDVAEQVKALTDEVNKYHGKHVLFRCSVCLHIFGTMDGLDTHEKDEHNKGSQELTCEGCGKIYQVRGAFEKHQEMKCPPLLEKRAAALTQSGHMRYLPLSMHRRCQGKQRDQNIMEHGLALLPHPALSFSGWSYTPSGSQFQQPTAFFPPLGTSPRRLSDPYFFSARPQDTDHTVDNRPPPIKRRRSEQVPRMAPRGLPPAELTSPPLPADVSRARAPRNSTSTSPVRGISSEDVGPSEPASSPVQVCSQEPLGAASTIVGSNGNPRDVVAAMSADAGGNPDAAGAQWTAVQQTDVYSGPFAGFANPLAGGTYSLGHLAGTDHLHPGEEQYFGTRLPGWGLFRAPDWSGRGQGGHMM
ncbi:hypothetical protein QBC39DRAFT_333166 [Podospora conica]|nr:hypothetical protein QBC39DRAFT_333166 [Schizothecium conicum]